MMPLEDLRALVRAQPFVPFRLYVSDQTSYEVRHPEMIMLGARSVVVGIPGTLPDVYERFVTVALAHVTRLEPLPTPAVG